MRRRRRDLFGLSSPRPRTDVDHIDNRPPNPPFNDVPPKHSPQMPGPTASPSVINLHAALDEAAYSLGVALTIIEFLRPADETDRHAVASMVAVFSNQVADEKFRRTVDRLLGL